MFETKQVAITNGAEFPSRSLPEYMHHPDSTFLILSTSTVTLEVFNELTLIMTIQCEDKEFPQIWSQDLMLKISTVPTYSFDSCRVKKRE